MSLNTTYDNQSGTVHPLHLQTYAYAIIGLVMMSASAIGIILNGLIVYIFWRRTSLNTPTNCFILALSFLDFSMSLFGLPMVAVSSFAEHWVFGDKGCVYYGFIMTFIGLSTISILTIISFDRYIVIVKSHLKPVIGRRVAVGMIMGCVLYGLAWAIAPLVGWSEYVLEGVHISCSVNWNSNQATHASFSMSMLVFCLAVPLGVICFCYGSIFYKVRTTSLAQMHFEGNRGSTLDRNVAKTIMWMIVAFMFSWFPYSILSLIAVVGGTSNIPPGLAVSPAVMAKISVVWNPLIYTYRNRDIRKSMLELCPFLTCLFNARCVRLQDQAQIRPDVYTNVREGMTSTVPIASTSIGITQTNSNRLNLHRQGRQPNIDNECNKLTREATLPTLDSNFKSRLVARNDMFCVNNEHTTL